jgi:hypothetical protein
VQRVDVNDPNFGATEMGVLFQFLCNFLQRRSGEGVIEEGRDRPSGRVKGGGVSFKERDFWTSLPLCCF